MARTIRMPLTLMLAILLLIGLVVPAFATELETLQEPTLESDSDPPEETIQPDVSEGTSALESDTTQTSDPPDDGLDGSIEEDFPGDVEDLGEDNVLDYPEGITDAFILRMNPNKGDYNLYCYCCKRDWLDRHMKAAEKGIRFIDPNYKERFRLEDGDMIRIVASNGEQRDRTARYIDDYHMELSGGLGGNLYHICEFAERMEAAQTKDIIPLRKSLPEKCYSTLLDTGEIVVLKRGETGYYPTDIPFKTREEAKEIVDAQNKMLGVTPAQREAMKAGSMFGFHVPAADPKNYDELGNPAKYMKRNRSPER